MGGGSDAQSWWLNGYVCENLFFVVVMFRCGGGGGIARKCIRYRVSAFAVCRGAEPGFIICLIHTVTQQLTLNVASAANAPPPKKTPPLFFNSQPASKVSLLLNN